MVIKCEVLGAALREARSLSDQMKVDVHVYKGSQLMATVQRAQKGGMDSERWLSSGHRCAPAAGAGQPRDDLIN